MVDLLGVDIDSLRWHVNFDNNLVLLAKHLRSSEFAEAYFCSAVVRVAHHQEQIYVSIARLKLANAVDGDPWDDRVHHGLHTIVVARRDDLLAASSTLFDALAH